MMYAIQVCHPNDLATGEWKTVDKVLSFEDSLSFPVFDVYEGILVRIVSDVVHYTGVFKNGEWIDIGPQSNVMKIANWNNPWNQDDFEYTGMDFVSCWTVCRHPKTMIDVVAHFLTNRRHVNLLMDCVKMTVPFVVHDMKDRVYEGFSLVQSWIDDEISEQELDRAGSKFAIEYNEYVGSNLHVPGPNHAICGVINLMQWSTQDTDRFGRSTVDYVERSFFDKTDYTQKAKIKVRLRLCNKIREFLPAHELVKYLV